MSCHAEIKFPHRVAQQFVQVELWIKSGRYLRIWWNFLKLDSRTGICATYKYKIFVKFQDTGFISCPNWLRIPWYVKRVNVKEIRETTHFAVGSVHEHRKKGVKAGNNVKTWLYLCPLVVQKKRERARKCKKKFKYKNSSKIAFH